MGLAQNELIDRSTRRGRGALAALTIGSAVAILDGTVVSIALPTIGRELDASLAQLQWIVNGYMLSLTALILVGGSLGDRAGAVGSTSWAWRGSRWRRCSARSP